MVSVLLFGVVVVVVGGGGGGVVVVVVADDVFTAPWNWHVFTTHVERYASVHTLHMPKHVM